MTQASALEEALERFREVFERAQQVGLKEPAAMTLATCDSRGHPTSRIVLLRGFDERGFVFYTNSQSRKGEQLADNARAALCLFWDALEEQVRVEGDVEKVSDAENDAYWDRRHRESQIGAWVSSQSSVLDRRETLEREVKEMTRRFEGQDVPRPPHWHGYRVLPRRIEFWKSRPARLHERTVYEKQNSHWSKFLLYP